MRRVLHISLLGVAALVFVVLSSALFLTRTNPGREIVRARIEAIAGSALGGPVSIHSLRGNLLRELYIGKITLEDATGEWLTANSVSMRWRPIALIRRDLLIDDFEIDGLVYSRRPELSKGESDSEVDKPLPLPTNIPDFSVGALRITNARLAFGESEYRLDGAGSAETRGNRLYLRFEANSEGERDLVDIALDYAPADNRVFADITIASRNGLLSSLAGIGDPIYVSMRGDSPLDAIIVTVDSTLGDLGELSGAIEAAQQPDARAAFDFRFSSGARFVAYDELSKPVTGVVGVRKGDAKSEVLVELTEIQSRAGALNANAKFIFENGAVAAFSGNSDLALAADYRPDIAKYIGRNATVVFEGFLDGAARIITADVTTELLAVAIETAQTNFRSSFTGPLRITAAPNAALPKPLQNGFDASANIQKTPGGALLVSGLSLNASDAALHGSANLDLESRRLNATGDVMLGAISVNNLVKFFEPNGAVNADFDIVGSLENFSINAEFDAPGSNVGGSDVPAFSGSINVAGLPSRPMGDLRFSARAPAQGELKATLRSSANGEITLQQLDYTSPLFYLRGNGAYTPSSQAASINMSYSGGSGAMPWPGVTLEGDASIKGLISRDRALNDISIEAQALTYNKYDLSQLKGELKGPPDAAQMTLAARELHGVPLGPITNLKVDALMDLSNGARIRVSKIEALVANNALSLSEPATLAFTPALEINGARFNYGGSGKIDLDAAITNERWTAEIDVSEINLPQTDGRASVNLRLDTDETPRATGDFILRSLIADNDLPPLQGAIEWRGDTLSIKSAPSSPLTLDISAPLRLQRDNGLGLANDGPLAGTIGFDGRAELLTAFAPPELQSLTGDVVADFALSGDLSRPIIDGNMKLSNGQYTELDTGLALASVHLEATANYAAGGQSQLTLRGSARGPKQTRDDTIKIDGVVDLAARSMVLTATLDDAELSAYPVDSVRASGTLSVNGDVNNLSASGDINVNELNAEIASPEDTGLVPIEIVAYNATPESLETDEAASSLDYDITITADNRIFIRGRGLESEWSANVTAESTDDGGLILGSLTLRRGWLDFSGRRFDFSSGAITFDRLSPNDPTLDLRAEYQTSDGVTAIIAVSGRASSPSISLQSTPQRPPEDVMALVLFGKSAQDLTPLESLQTAQALASLGGIGPFGGQGVTGRLRQAIGLDLLNIDIDPENGGGSLTVGKYVADGFFVSATQDAQGQGGSVRVKYEITDRISVETEIEQTGEQTVSANWSKDF